jgi:hypothetical protein
MMHRKGQAAYVVEHLSTAPRPPFSIVEEERGVRVILLKHETVDDCVCILWHLRVRRNRKFDVHLKGVI